MCVCVCVCVCVTANVSMSLCLCGYICVCVSASVYVCTLVSLHTDLRCAGAGSAGSPGGPGTLALPDSQLWRRNGESERLEARRMADVSELSGRWSFPSSPSPPVASRPSIPGVHPLPRDGAGYCIEGLWDSGLSPGYTSTRLWWA